MVGPAVSGCRRSTSATASSVAPLLVLGEQVEVAARSDHVEDGRLRCVLRPLDELPRGRAEGRADLRILRVAAVVVAVGAHRGAELPHPFDPLVAEVPEQAQHPARPQHACRFGGRGGRVHPVPRLCEGDGIRLRIRKRDGLARALMRRNLRKQCRQFGAHARGGFDRDHGAPRPPQQPCELSRAGADVDDAQGVAGDEPVDRLPRVRGSGRVVPGRDSIEGCRVLRHGRTER